VIASSRRGIMGEGTSRGDVRPPRNGDPCASTGRRYAAPGRNAPGGEGESRRVRRSSTGAGTRTDSGLGGGAKRGVRFEVYLTLAEQWLAKSVYVGGLFSVARQWAATPNAGRTGSPDIQSRKWAARGVDSSRIRSGTAAHSTMHRFAPVISHSLGKTRPVRSGSMRSSTSCSGWCSATIRHSSRASTHRACSAPVSAKPRICVPVRSSYWRRSYSRQECRCASASISPRRNSSRSSAARATRNIAA